MYHLGINASLPKPKLADIESGRSAPESVDLVNALATAMTGSEQVAAQPALEGTLASAEGLSAEREALI